MSMVGHGRYVYLPLILFGVLMGAQPIEWFVAMFVGSLLEMSLWFLGLTFLMMYLKHVNFVSREIAGRMPASQEGRVAT